MAGCPSGSTKEACAKLQCEANAKAAHVWVPVCANPYLSRLHFSLSLSLSLSRARARARSLVLLRDTRMTVA